MSVLPNTLGNLLSNAITAVDIISRDDRYKLDMKRWHQPFNKCKVCMTGCVMAYYLGADIEQYYIPDDFPNEIGKLYSIDDMRRGDFQEAYEDFHGLYPRYKNHQTCLDILSNNQKAVIFACTQRIENVRNKSERDESEFLAHLREYRFCSNLLIQNGM